MNFKRHKKKDRLKGDIDSHEWRVAALERRVKRQPQTHVDVKAELAMLPGTLMEYLYQQRVEDYDFDDFDYDYELDFLNWYDAFDDPEVETEEQVWNNEVDDNYEDETW